LCDREHESRNDDSSDLFESLNGKSNLYGRVQVILILNDIGYIHYTVCHKHEFVNKKTYFNKEAAESFNNKSNLAIKRSKGISASKRSDFLKELV
jgi:hypothetical protein